jgi:hypothetical protein
MFLCRDEALSGAPLVTANGSSSNGSSSSVGSSGHQALPVLLSQHHGLVSALAAAHPSYVPTVRLAKRWMGAHLLLGGQVRLLGLLLNVCPPVVPLDKSVLLSPV